MTLRRRSPVLEVYCCDYRIRIGDPHVAVPDPYLIPKGLADDGWTVLRVPFAEPGIICGEDVDDWLDDWALLFLDHVRTVGHTEEDRSTRRELALKWSEAQHHEAAVGGAAATATTRTARATDGASWHVSRAVIPMPAKPTCQGLPPQGTVATAHPAAASKGRAGQSGPPPPCVPGVTR